MDDKQLPCGENPARSRPPRLLGLLPCLVFAALVFPGIFRHISVHDEGHFLLAAHTLATGARMLLSGSPVSEIAAAIHSGGGTLYFAAKPGYILVLAALGILAGGLTTFHAALVNLLFGVAGVALTQNLVARRFGTLEGLWAGLFLATMPVYCQFARQVLGVVPMVAWMMAGGLLLQLAVSGRQRRGAMLGALAGTAFFIGFTHHYNGVVLAAALVLAAWREIGRWPKVGLLAGAVASAALFEAMFHVAARLVGGTYPEFRTFLGELAYNFSAHQAGGAPSQDGVRGYGADAWVMLGRTLAGAFHWVTALALIGLGVALKHGKVTVGEATWLALVAGLPLLAWSLYPWKVERSFASVAPGMAAGGGVVAARFLRSWTRAGSGRPAGMWTFIGVAPLASLAGIGALMSLPVEERGMAARAVEANEAWIATAPPGTFTAASFHWRSAPLWKWELGPHRANRGRPTPGIDFSSFSAPAVHATDPLALDSVGPSPTGWDGAAVGRLAVAGIDVQDSQGRAWGFRGRREMIPWPGSGDSAPSGLEP